MPIFEYQCPSCKIRFEKIVRNDSIVVGCPSCGVDKATKLLSSFAVAVSSSRGRGNENGACPCGAPRRGMCSE